MKDQSALFSLIIKKETLLNFFFKKRMILPNLTKKTPHKIETKKTNIIDLPKNSFKL